MFHVSSAMRPIDDSGIPTYEWEISTPTFLKEYAVPLFLERDSERETETETETQRQILFAK